MEYNLLNHHHHSAALLKKIKSFFSIKPKKNCGEKNKKTRNQENACLNSFDCWLIDLLKISSNSLQFVGFLSWMESLVVNGIRQNRFGQDKDTNK